MSVFWGSLPDMGSIAKSCLPAVGLFIISLGLLIVKPLDTALAASAYSPRHSGLEAPGGPKPLEGLPGHGDRSGTTPANTGYTDAYGNPIRDVSAEEKPRAKRPSPGAYGSYGKKSEYDQPLPDPSRRSSSPAWVYK